MAHTHKSGRKSPMKLRVDIEIQGELLVATAHGTLSFHEVSAPSNRCSVKPTKNR